MNTNSKIVRFAVLASSLTLLTCYVVYSHHSAQVIADTAADRTELPQIISVANSDPIAAQAAASSHDLRMQPTLDESPVDSIWKPAMLPSIPSNRGIGVGESGRMLTPEKLAAKYFQSVAAERRVMMSGSKSAQVFVPPPARPLIDLPPLLPVNAELFSFNFPIPINAISHLDVATRVLGDDGSGLGMSGRIRSHEKLPMDFLYMRIMSSSSKSGIVFPPSFFQPSPPPMQLQGTIPSNP